MPSTSDKLELAKWVDTLPNRESLSGFDAVLNHCARRYNNSPGELQLILDKYVELFKKNMHKAMHDTGLQERHLPSPSEIEEAINRSIMSSLLRMWVYASEYYQRYSLDLIETELSDEALAQLLMGGSDDADSN